MAEMRGGHDPADKIHSNAFGDPQARGGTVAAGGLFYTVGIVFYTLDTRVAHAHGVWHLFVLAGSATHYVAILRYVI